MTQLTLFIYFGLRFQRSESIVEEKPAASSGRGGQGRKLNTHVLSGKPKAEKVNRK